MRKVISLLLILLTLFMLFGCGEQKSASLDETDASSATVAAVPVEEPEPEELSGIVPNGHFMVSDGEYIYYSEESPDPEQEGLYRIDTDLTQKLKLSDGLAHSLGLDSEYLYFYAPDDRCIWRMAKDGSAREMLPIPIESARAYPQVQNGNVYYLDDDQFRVYPIGGSPVDISYPLGSQHIYRFVLADTGIYYETYPESTLYFHPFVSTHDPDSGFPPPAEDWMLDDLICEKVWKFTWSDGRLYYLEAAGQEHGVEIYRLMCTAPGEEPQDLGVQGLFRELYACDGVVYYTKMHWDEEMQDVFGEKLYSFSPETGVEMRLFNQITQAGIYGEEELDFLTIYGVGGDHIWISYLGEISAWGSLDGSTYFPWDDLQLPTQRADELGEYAETYGPESSYLELSADELSACFRLVRIDGSTEFMEFLAPGESKTVSFPCGRYTLKTAEGETWISEEEAFGSDGHYSTTDIYTFMPDSTYYISTGTRGDFYGENASGFLN